MKFPRKSASRAVIDVDRDQATNACAPPRFCMDARSMNFDSYTVCEVIRNPSPPLPYCACAVPLPQPDDFLCIAGCDKPVSFPTQ